MVKEVVDAEVVVPKEEEKKKDFVKDNKLLLVFASIALFLIMLFLVYSVFFSNPYKYSFNISGVDFVSNEFTPSVFFKEFKENDSFLVSVDVVNDSSSAWVVNSMNLWLVALNADKKETVLVVRNVDESGLVNSCITNDGSVLESRDINAFECDLILSDSSKARVFISLSSKDFVLMEDKKLTVFASSVKTISMVNYYAIKEMYSNFDEVLALVNQKIGSV